MEILLDVYIEVTTVDFTKLLPKYSKFRSKVRKFELQKIILKYTSRFVNKASDWSMHELN